MRCLRDRQTSIEQTQQKILELITRCIDDIQDTVTSSGLKIRDINLGIEMYQTTSGSYIIELNYANNKCLSRSSSS
jgi:hypothetical protein